MLLNHIGRFGTTEVIHADQGPPRAGQVCPVFWCYTGKRLLHTWVAWPIDRCECLSSRDGVVALADSWLAFITKSFHFLEVISSFLVGEELGQ